MCVSLFSSSKNKRETQPFDLEILEALLHPEVEHEDVVELHFLAMVVKKRLIRKLQTPPHV